MKIITISRQFGSGGRELGKRLADILGFDYYDREIITAISQSKGMDERYIERTLNNHAWQNIPVTFRHSFRATTVMSDPQVSLLVEQKKVIEGIAKAGKDCVIVGRNADVILRHYKPFRVFVCAETEAKIKRCVVRAEPTENLTSKQLVQNMKRIDKNRSRTREMMCESRWGDPNAYDLTVNTTDWEIKELAPAVAEFAMRRFGGNHANPVI